MKYRIAIDGACRRNGQPDCVSSGGVFVQRFDDNDNQCASYALCTVDYCSTNQRGELYALIKALSLLVDTCGADDDAIIVTDSEYIFNAMTKGWVTSWESKGYITASGNPVKNSDLWRHIYKLSNALSVDVAYYHIKGHTVPFGKVTAENLLLEDVTGMKLYDALCKNYDVKQSTKAAELAKANELSKRNNGFELDATLLKDFVVINAMADAIAGQCVAEADRTSAYRDSQS